MTRFRTAAIWSVGVLSGVMLHLAWAESTRPAYLVVSSKVVSSEEALAPYRKSAVPLAEAAGLQILARGDAVLLEGEWTHHQSITVEKFDSMPALLSFWHSPEYREAKKLRDGLLEVDFIVAVEGN